MSVLLELSLPECYINNNVNAASFPKGADCIYLVGAGRCNYQQHPILESYSLCIVSEPLVGVILPPLSSLPT